MGTNLFNNFMVLGGDDEFIIGLCHRRLVLRNVTCILHRLSLRLWHCKGRNASTIIHRNIPRLLLPNLYAKSRHRCTVLLRKWINFFRPSSFLMEKKEDHQDGNKYWFRKENKDENAEGGGDHAYHERILLLGVGRFLIFSGDTSQRTRGNGWADIKHEKKQIQVT